MWDAGSNGATVSRGNWGKSKRFRSERSDSQNSVLLTGSNLGDPLMSDGELEAAEQVIGTNKDTD
jgi:hypothetical protein